MLPDQQNNFIRSVEIAEEAKLFAKTAKIFSGSASIKIPQTRINHFSTRSHSSEMPGWPQFLRKNANYFLDCRVFVSDGNHEVSVFITTPQGDKERILNGPKWQKNLSEYDEKISNYHFVSSFLICHCFSMLWKTLFYIFHLSVYLL